MINQPYKVLALQKVLYTGAQEPKQSKYSCNTCKLTLVNKVNTSDRQYTEFLILLTINGKIMDRLNSNNYQLQL